MGSEGAESVAAPQCRNLEDPLMTRSNGGVIYDGAEPVGIQGAASVAHKRSDLRNTVKENLYMTRTPVY